MSRGAKVFVVAMGLVGVFCLATAAAVAWAVHAVVTSPPVEVSVRDGGSQVALRLPAGLLVGAAAIAPTFAVRGGGADELRLSEWSPVLAAVADELGTMPDATLLEIIDGDERVTVVKHGHDLSLRVRSPGGDVDVTMPADLAGDLVSRLVR